MRAPAVGSVARATVGSSKACPECSGLLGPLFSQYVAPDGTWYPVVDVSIAVCRECGTMFPVRVDVAH